MLLYALAVVGWYSRLLEHDADVDACLSAPRRDDEDPANDFCLALESLSGHAPENRFSHWLHPPTSQRTRWIRQLAADPAQAAPFRRRVAWIGGLILFLHAAAGILALLG
jgi:hypothetical protein